MLYEKDVVDAVCNLLKQMNFTIEQCALTNQQGFDIIFSKKFEHEIIKLYVEAKGETSSRVGSSNFNNPFDDRQVLTHIGKALYKTAEALSIEENGVKIYAGIALPDTISHRRFLNKIKPFVLRSNIIVFWVKEGGNVTIESAIFDSL